MFKQVVGALVALGMIGFGSAADRAAAAEKTLKIGAAVSLSGALSREGRLLVEGYELWQKKVNEAGGIKIGDDTYKIEIVSYDDESKAQTSAQLTEKLITSDDVSFIFGPYSSGIATATAVISERYKVLTLAPMATANSLYGRGYKYIFTQTPLADRGLYPVLELASEMDPKPQSVAVVGPDDLFPNIVGDSAAKKAEEMGFKLVYTAKYPKASTDLASVATQIKSAAPDVVLATGYVQDTLLLLKSMRELKVDPAIVGLAMSIGIQDFRDALGPSANGIMGTDMWVSTLTYSDPVFTDSATFAKEFEAEYGNAPTYHAASGASAGVILQMALEKAGSTDVDKVREALLSMEGETFYGRFKFEDDGTNSLGTAAVSQLIESDPKVIFPPAVAQEKALYPRSEM
ncbi:amino acid ABC transporter substrate-binding protein [Afifella sp. IM 167]|uniref:amino acid ABC transporter substrate-binding protein n=1 Tax=Afifella sp. IM 167 TaxID=2033586 RepID=UPI001CCFDC86|nr:amino acid ABC transporter substrate-binding protein [Afifella sp. IM 167]MBZ8134484.1 ABC transporter substrate-binding protein [Afifella sp. IM 167]